MPGIEEYKIEIHTLPQTLPLPAREKNVSDSGDLIFYDSPGLSDLTALRLDVFYDNQCARAWYCLGREKIDNFELAQTAIEERKWEILEAVKRWHNPEFD